MQIAPEQLKDLFAKGIECFPCTVSIDATGKKTAALGTWRKSITEDQALARLRPEHNCLAIKTGSCSGLWALDVDCKPGKPNGYEAIKGIDIPESTPCQKTPSGGMHYFFAMPAGQSNSTTNAALGLDVRSEGGLIFTGEWYSWVIPIDALDEPPTALLELVYSKAPSAAVQDYNPADPLDKVEPIGVPAEKCKKLLDKLDPDCGRDEWRNVGMALHHEFQGSKVGLQLWEAWSIDGLKYNEGEPAKQWASFGGYTGQPLTAAYLLKMGTPVEVVKEQIGAEERKKLDGIQPYHTTDGVASIPPLDAMIIDGIARERSMILVGAASKAYKTWFTKNLAVSLAHGTTFLNRQCKKSKVLYCNFELKKSTDLHRISTIASNIGVPYESENFDVLNLRGEIITIEAFSYLVSKLIKQHAYKVLVIDPLYRLMFSKEIRQLSENAATDMMFVLGHLDRIVEKHKITLVVVHHFSKGMQGNKNAIDRFSGSGSFARFFDTLLSISELDEMDCFRIEISSRDLPRCEPISLRWDYPAHTIDTTLDTAQIKGTQARPASASDRRSGAQSDDEHLTKIIYENPLKSMRVITAIAMGSGISKDRARGSIERLVAAESVITKTGLKNSKLLQCSSVPVFQNTGQDSEL